MAEETWRDEANALGFNGSALQSYNEYVAARAEQRRKNRAPFEEALAAVGVTETYDRLTGKRTEDPRLFELGLAHLKSGKYDDETRGWIASIFETRAASPYWNELAALFRAAPEGGEERDGLAAAMAECARAEHVEQMMSFVEDARFGDERIYFLRPINRLRRTSGRSFVARFLDDPVLGREATAIMRGWSRNEG